MKYGWEFIINEIKIILITFYYLNTENELREEIYASKKRSYMSTDFNVSDRGKYNCLQNIIECWY